VAVAARRQDAMRNAGGQRDIDGSCDAAVRVVAGMRQGAQASVNA
jgi:hypothetical protein